MAGLNHDLGADAVPLSHPTCYSGLCQLPQAGELKY